MDPHTQRILWVTTSVSWDGPGRALAALLQHWPAADQIAICTLRGAEPAFRQAMRPGVDVRALEMRHVADLSAIKRLVALCRAWQPDLIHTQLSRADWIGRLVARRLSIPVVSTIQNLHSRMYAAEFSWPTSRIAGVLDRFSGRSVRRFIAVSAGVKDDLVHSGVSVDRIVVIPNPFDPGRSAAPGRRLLARAEFGCADGDVVVGTVALLKEQKGIHDLVDAARLVVARDPRVRFVHVGGGPLESHVRRWVAEAGLGDRFRLVGRVADPLSLLPGMDVFALPSLWEGLPVALLEAMAAGLPAVGTRVSGIEEVIVDRVTGRLVPPRDPAALASAILEMAATDTVRRDYGEAGRRRLSAFDARPIAQATRQVYVDVLAEAARQGNLQHRQNP